MVLMENVRAILPLIYTIPSLLLSVSLTVLLIWRFRTRFYVLYATGLIVVSGCLRCALSPSPIGWTWRPCAETEGSDPPNFACRGTMGAEGLRSGPWPLAAWGPVPGP